MNKLKIILLPLTFFTVLIGVSAFAMNASKEKEKPGCSAPVQASNQTVNLFVTHGHCSTPFGGVIDQMQLEIPPREDLGNPLEYMKLSFEIDPNSFNACAGEEYTKNVQTPGLFMGDNNEKMIFTSKHVYTMGIDWYQINGTLSIKGVEKEMNLFVTGVRKPEDQMPSSLIIQGRLNLFDWGIDYDQLVHGGPSTVPTQWLFMNMKVEVC